MTVKNFFRWLGAGVIAVLMALLGIERKKVEKKDKKIAEQQQEIQHEKKQNKVYKAAKEATVEAVGQIAEVDGKQEAEEQKIEEAKTDEETIAIANDIVDRFNARH